MAQLPKENEDSNFDLKYTNVYHSTIAYNAEDFLYSSSTVHKYMQFMATTYFVLNSIFIFI